MNHQVKLEILMNAVGLLERKVLQQRECITGNNEKMLKESEHASQNKELMEVMKTNFKF